MAKKLTICYQHIIAICETPDAFKYWLTAGNGDLNNENFDFVKRANEIAKKMRVNSPIEFQGKLKNCKPATCTADLVKMNLVPLVQKEIVSPSASSSSQSQQQQAYQYTSTSNRWRPGDYQYPGEPVEMSFSNGKTMKFYSPYVISMCENPAAFKEWLQKANFDINNEFYLFVQRAKEIEILMKNNRPITVFGALQQKTRTINNSEELANLKLADFASSVLM